MQIKPISKKQNIVIQELEKELLVYDLRTNQAFCLNETSAIVFQLCDGTKTIAEIADSMSRKLKTLVSEDFVWLALNELRKDGLLENSDKFQDYFAGMSRREMVRKVGLASMIALPIILSVAAPSVALAASCVASGDPVSGRCAGDANGCNGFCQTISGGQCCSGQAQASSQVSCVPIICTCVCV